MGALSNLDLFTVGIAVAGNLILGFVILFSDRKSATNTLFFSLSLVLSGWSIVNYFSYQTNDYNLALLLVRLVMFFAAPIGALFLLFVDTFPNREMGMKKRNIIALLTLMIISMALSLSPLVFSGINLSPDRAPQPITQPGILIFVVVPVLAIILGILKLHLKTLRSSGVEKKQNKLVGLGVGIMFGLIITLNFILPAFFNNTRFISLSAVFTLPFVAFTAYAIFKHHLLNVKVIATEIIAFILAIVTLFEVILSEDVTTLIFRFGVFSLVLAFGILLIKSVLKEVEQREELQKLSEELKLKNSQLEELSQFKSDMLSLASHDIKRPLATIKGFASILKQGLYGEINDKVKETLGKIISSDDDLINTINTILDLRRIEQGYKFESVKLRTILDLVVNELKSAAEEKKVALTLDASTDPTVNADPEKLKHAIQNIVDNALKYTPQGFVKVEMKEEGEFIQISVTDSGLGIPAELLPKLFAEQFVRDERVKQKIRGTGLGLHLTGKIIAAHNGKVWAESAGEGKGSKFYVKLKKA